MSNTTFNGPVRSKDGFLEWDGNAWVPVSGGGGDVGITFGGIWGGPTWDGSTPLQLNTTASGVTPGTYVNPTLTVNAEGRVTNAVNGTAPSIAGGMKTFASTIVVVNGNGTSFETIPAGAFPINIWVRLNNLYTGSMSIALGTTLLADFNASFIGAVPFYSSVIGINTSDFYPYQFPTSPTTSAQPINISDAYGSSGTTTIRVFVDYVIV